MSVKHKIPDSKTTVLNTRGRQLVVTAAAAAVSLAVVMLPVPDLLKGLVVVILFAVVFIFASFHKGSDAERLNESRTGEVFDPDTEERLEVLEDVGLFLGSSLNLADMFRLVSSRIEEIIPCRASALFLSEGGESFERTLGYPDEIGNRDLLRTLVTKAGETNDLVFGDAVGSGPDAAVAIPLRRAEGIFAVLVLGVDHQIQDQQRYRILIDAVASRIEPVLAASVALERSSVNSMTDPLTGLPNERAFRLVLENRLAEARRFRKESRLTVLAVDISGFAEINSSHGHNFGDKILIFVGETISSELREMDLVARTTGDEFLVILPMTAEESHRAVTERLTSALSAGGPATVGGISIKIKLNFGAASFGKADETAGDLIRTARAERDAPKTGKSNQVLRFPTKYDN